MMRAEEEENGMFCGAVERERCGRTTPVWGQARAGKGKG